MGLISANKFGEVEVNGNELANENITELIDNNLDQNIQTNLSENIEEIQGNNCDIGLEEDKHIIKTEMEMIASGITPIETAMNVSNDVKGEAQNNLATNEINESSEGCDIFDPSVSSAVADT